MVKREWVKYFKYLRGMWEPQNITTSDIDGTAYYLQRDFNLPKDEAVSIVKAFMTLK